MYIKATSNHASPPTLLGAHAVEMLGAAAAIYDVPPSLVGGATGAAVAPHERRNIKVHGAINESKQIGPK